jgi:drug/metabolite transporter (DMT)-like permease
LGLAARECVSRNLKADVLLRACTLIWGASFVVVKAALVDASVFAFLAIRFAVAAAVLAALCFREVRRLDGPSLRAGAVMGCCMFGGYAFQTAGIHLTTPSKAAFVTGFSVVLVPVFLGVFARQRIGPAIWAGALVAVAGLYYLTVPSSGFSDLNRGDLLVLCGAVAFAFHIIAISRYARRHSPGVLNLLQVVMTLLMISLAGSFLSVTGRESFHVAWTARLLAAVLLTGVLATAVAFSGQVWAQQHTSASHAAIVFTLEPVFAALTSFVFFHERLGARALAGAALILAGILLAELEGPAPAAAE